MIRRDGPVRSMHLITLLLLLTSSLVGVAQDSTFQYVDFVTSSVDPRIKWTQFATEWFPRCVAHWDSFHPGKVKAQARPIIPKIIHQIWLGGPLPERYKKWQASWKKHHPDWIYKLWTDKDVESFNLINKKMYEWMTNLGARADILRAEILYQFGGLYVDTDFECWKPLDEFHYKYSFYAAVEKSPFMQLGNSFIASAPGHPLLRAYIDLIGKNTNKNNIIGGVGPGCFTRAIMNNFDINDPLVMIFPASYFFPLAWMDHKSIEVQKKAYEMPESYACHYWEAAWKKKKNSADEKKR